MIYYREITPGSDEGIMPWSPRIWPTPRTGEPLTGSVTTTSSGGNTTTSTGTTGGSQSGTTTGGTTTTTPASSTTLPIGVWISGLLQNDLVKGAVLLGAVLLFASMGSGRRR